MKAAVFLAVVALLLGGETWHPVPPSAPLVGFSYSPLTSQWAHRDPASDLAILLAATNPDLVRLPVYWDSVEPTPNTLDFSSVDQLLVVVEQHNLAAKVKTMVVLTVGARNFVYPELHAPEWAGQREQPNLGEVQAAEPYRDYFDGSIIRYRGSPLLYAWQVENEPLDYVGNTMTGDDQITVAQLSWEIAEVHRLDPDHKAATTSFDGWNLAVDMAQLYAAPALAGLGVSPSGHPEEALSAADVLGLDLYVDGPSTPFRFTSADLRSAWKQQAVAFWTARANEEGKSLWVAEMQAQPWSGVSGFSTANLVSSAVDYRQEPVSIVLLWGVETWLQDPAWMAAAIHAMDILRN